MCTQHNPSTDRNQTKLGILHNAVTVITQLEEQVSEPLNLSISTRRLSGPSEKHEPEGYGRYEEEARR